RDFLAAGDARDPIFRTACRQHADLSVHDSYSANDARRHVAAIHPSDGSGRGGGRGTDHAAAYFANNYFGVARGTERCSLRASWRGTREEPARRRCFHSHGDYWIDRDHRDDVGDAYV